MTVTWALSGAVTVAAVLLLRRLCRGRLSARLGYALWALVLIRLLVPVSFGATDLSLGNWLPDRVAPLAAASVPRMSEQAAVERAARDLALTDGPETMRAAVEGARQSGLTVAQAAELIWLVGAVGVGVCLVGANVRFALRLRRTRRQMSVTADGLPVYRTEAIEVPCLCGLLRPAVYVGPETAADATLLRHVLAHEAAHRRQGDHVWAVLRGVCLALHWFDPLVWLAASVSRRDGELACDEAAVRALGEGERAAYGRTLLTMTQRTSLLRAAAGMSAGGRELRERIGRLAARPRTTVGAVLTVVLVGALTVGCSFTGPAPTPQTAVDVTAVADRPEPVVAYARDYVQDMARYYEDDCDCEILRAEVVGLTDQETGTASLDEGLELYRLEYRIYPADPGAVVLAGGMRMEGGAITEWGSTGQPYLLLHWQDRTDGTTDWTRICVTNTDMIGTDYGTPELLAQYGSAYTAAALGLYETWQAEQ